jgi:hypothetical protein
MNSEHDINEFERRTQTALRSHAELLDAATQSRLTQARHAALAQRSPRSSWLQLRFLAPAGAVAASMLLAVLFFGNPRSDDVNPTVATALDEVELLADAEAYALTEEPDPEFLEWAAGQSTGLGS